MKPGDLVTFNGEPWEVGQWDGPKAPGVVRIRRASKLAGRVHDFMWAPEARLELVAAQEHRKLTCDGPRKHPNMPHPKDGVCGAAATHHDGAHHRHYCDECATERQKHPTLLVTRHDWAPNHSAEGSERHHHNEPETPHA